MVLKDSRGDWAVVTGKWMDFKVGMPERRGAYLWWYGVIVKLHSFTLSIMPCLQGLHVFNIYEAVKSNRKPFSIDSLWVYFATNWLYTLMYKAINTCGHFYGKKNDPKIMR